MGGERGVGDPFKGCFSRFFANISKIIGPSEKYSIYKIKVHKIFVQKRSYSFFVGLILAKIRGRQNNDFFKNYYLLEIFRHSTQQMAWGTILFTK